jgi:hypothetical protein
MHLKFDEILFILPFLPGRHMPREGTKSVHPLGPECHVLGAIGINETAEGREI